MCCDSWSSLCNFPGVYGVWSLGWVCRRVWVCSNGRMGLIVSRALICGLGLFVRWWWLWKGVVGVGWTV